MPEIKNIALEGIAFQNDYLFFLENDIEYDNYDYINQIYIEYEPVILDYLSCIRFVIKDQVLYLKKEQFELANSLFGNELLIEKNNKKYIIIPFWFDYPIYCNQQWNTFSLELNLTENCNRLKTNPPKIIIELLKNNTKIQKSYITDSVYFHLKPDSNASCSIPLHNQSNLYRDYSVAWRYKLKGKIVHSIPLKIDVIHNNSLSPLVEERDPKYYTLVTKYIEDMELPTNYKDIYYCNIYEFPEIVSNYSTDLVFSHIHTKKSAILFDEIEVILVFYRKIVS